MQELVTRLHNISFSHAAFLLLPLVIVNARLSPVHCRSVRSLNFWSKYAELV